MAFSVRTEQEREGKPAPQSWWVFRASSAFKSSQRNADFTEPGERSAILAFSLGNMRGQHLGLVRIPGFLVASSYVHLF